MSVDIIHLKLEEKERADQQADGIRATHLDTAEIDVDVCMFLVIWACLWWN